MYVPFFKKNMGIKILIALGPCSGQRTYLPSTYFDDPQFFLLNVI